MLNSVKITKKIIFQKHVLSKAAGDYVTLLLNKYFTTSYELKVSRERVYEDNANTLLKPNPAVLIGQSY